MSLANSLKWIIPALLLIGGVFTHLSMVPPTPIEEEIAVLFGGTLANNVAVDTTVETTNTGTNISSPGIVWTSDTDGYIFYEDSTGQLSLSSTTNSGSTWGAARRVDSVNTTDVVSFGVWWEGWTPGTTTTRFIHIVTTDTGVDDTYYTRLDLTTGTFSTTVLGTTQTATSCSESTNCIPSITMTATGTIYMMTMAVGDSWIVRCGQYNGCTTAANWHEITAYGGGAGSYKPMLLPIPGNDNLMAMYGDDNNLRYRIWSATTSSWWNTATQPIGSGIDFNFTYDGQLTGASLSTTTGLIFLTGSGDANDYTTADHDVEFFSFSTTTWSWTQKTDCTTDYTGGVIGAKVAWDETNDTLYCIMGLRSTIGTDTTGGIYFKTSTDGGTTWSATSTMVNDNADNINGMTVNIIGLERIGVTWNYTTAPRADQQYYDDIADLVADGGGGGTPGIIYKNNVIWLD